MVELLPMVFLFFGNGPRSILSLVMLIGLLACSSSRPCPDPCPDEQGQPPEIMNPYGTTFGRMYIRKMTLVQLQTEKTELEARLSKDKADSALLVVLNSPGFETFDSEYDSLASKSN